MHKVSGPSFGFKLQALMTPSKAFTLRVFLETPSKAFTLRVFLEDFLHCFPMIGTQ